MDRLITPYPHPSRATATAEAKGSDVPERLIKYIPAEIISGYMALSGLIEGVSANSPLRQPAAWMLFFAGLILTPVYLRIVQRPVGVQWWHLPISAVSFALLAYALGGPFKTTELMPGVPYESWFAAFVAGVFSWTIALVWKPVESPKPAAAPTAPE